MIPSRFDLPNDLPMKLERAEPPPSFNTSEEAAQLSALRFFERADYDFAVTPAGESVNVSEKDCQQKPQYPVCETARSTSKTYIYIYNPLFPNGAFIMGSA